MRKNYLQHRWTQSEIETLIDMRNKGLSYKEIGDYFGISRQAVCERCKTFTLPNYRNALNNPKIRRHNLARWIEQNYKTLYNFCSCKNIPHPTIRNILSARTDPSYRICRLIMLEAKDQNFIDLFEVDE